MTEAQIAVIREKARNKRYKKPLNMDFNIESILTNLYDMSSECCDVQYYFEADDPDLLSDLLGGDDQLQEFKVMFSDLSAQCEQMNEDLRDPFLFIPKWFDAFFAGISDDSQTMLGWDSFEQDYFGLLPGFESREAISEARKKVERCTKEEILDGASLCFRIAVNYLSLKSRYEDLKASMDIIRERNRAELNALHKINEVYEKADKASDGFRFTWEKEVATLDKLIDAIDPYSQIWLQ